MTGLEWRVSFIPYYLTSKMKWAAPKTYEAINFLSKEGFDGVEWMLGHHFNDVASLRRLVQATRRKGLEVSNIMCWEDFATSDKKLQSKRIDELQKYIKAASSLSIPVLNTFTGPMTWNPDHEKVGRDITEGKAWSSVADSFSKVVETAEKCNVIVTLEAVFGMLVHDYYTIKEFLGYFDSKNLAINLDPSHLALYGNDPAWAITKLGKRVRHVHVKDVMGRPGIMGEDFNFPFLGEGIIDWKAFFQALKMVGYSGFLSLEFENDAYLNNVCEGDWSVAARLSRQRLMRLLKNS